MLTCRPVLRLLVSNSGLFVNVRCLCESYKQCFVCQWILTGFFGGGGVVIQLDLNSVSHPNPPTQMTQITRTTVFPVLHRRLSLIGPFPITEAASRAYSVWDFLWWYDISVEPVHSVHTSRTSVKSAWADVDDFGEQLAWLASCIAGKGTHFSRRTPSLTAYSTAKASSCKIFPMIGNTLLADSPLRMVPLLS